MTTPQAQEIAPDPAAGPVAAPAAPLPVLPLEYAPPAGTANRVWRCIVLICLPLGLLTCAIGVTAIHIVDVESVVVTGPGLFATGLLALLGGLFARNRVAAAVGAGHCAICLLFLLLVNLLHWSPGDAHFPFLVMGTVYTLAVAVPTVYAFADASADR